MNVYLFNFYDVYFATIEKNIDKNKGVFIFCNNCPEKGHPTRQALSKITKNKELQALKLYDLFTRRGS